MNDLVKNPRHYEGDGKIQCKDAMKSMVHGIRMPLEIGYWWITSLKYIWRWPHKNGEQDIDKAIQSLQYLKRAIRDSKDSDIQKGRGISL